MILCRASVPVALLVLATIVLAPLASGAPQSASQKQAPGKMPPSNLTPPSVSGTSVAGSSLTGDPGTWSGSNVTLAIQWQRCDSLGNGCANVAGATSSTLALKTTDVGYRFRIFVTASNKNGQATAVSAASPVVAPPPQTQIVAPSSISSPTISGTPTQGQMLTSSTGSWNGTQPLTYAYQWLRCDSGGANCVAVGGATSGTYTLVAADVGSRVRVRVTATNAAGSASSTSAATAVVAALPSSPSSSGLLTWAPPALSSPLTVQVRDTGQVCPEGTGRWQNPNQPWLCYLDPARDYILRLGNRQDPGGLNIMGGRNVVIIGGQVTVPVRTCCDRSDEWKSNGIYLQQQTGVVHIEGVLIVNAADGIVIRAPQAIVQLQNIRINNLHAYRDNLTLAHPDIIQTFDGPAEVRIDRLTSDSDWTGLSWFKCCTTAQVYPARVNAKRINFSGNLQPNTLLKWSDGTTRTKPNFPVFTYMNYATGVHTCQNCWVSTGWWTATYRRKLQDSAGFIDANGNQVSSLPYRVTGYDAQIVTAPANSEIGRRQGDYIEWPSIANLVGVRWYWGVPPAGDFVPSGVAGPGYTSPGYGG
jgi:hypothetical protein